MKTAMAIPVTTSALLLAEGITRQISCLSKFRELDATMPVGQMIFFLVAALNEGESLGVIAERSQTPMSTASRYLTNLSIKLRNGCEGLHLLIAVEDPNHRARKMITLTVSGKKFMEELLANETPLAVLSVDHRQPSIPEKGMNGALEDTIEMHIAVVPTNTEKSPWADANPDIKSGYNFRMDQELHLKLSWITDNVPKHSSIQKVLMFAVDKYVEDVIKNWYPSQGS